MNRKDFVIYFRKYLDESSVPFYNKIRSSSKGGEMREKNSVKLPRRQFFASIFTLGGRPMLPDAFSVKKIHSLNREMNQ